uniref:Dual oxidase maturation factor 2 n=1 Tax=Anolis carolinensis TaxID=28377 RepID=H9GBP2_ANOCA
MTLFGGIYPFYPQPRKPVVFDINLVIVIVVFLVIAFSFLLILPGIRGRARLYWLFRVIISLFIGGVIVESLSFSVLSQQAQISTDKTSYLPANRYIVVLGHVFLSFAGNPVEQLNETIDYNEYFPWWFGANYDHEYDEGLHQGLPNPILYVAETFSGSSPCGLHGLYRMAGHYASATLWVAFCAWLVSNLLFSMPVPVYGGYMILVTGAFLIFALLSFATVRNAPACIIQFGHASLEAAYGASFWLTLFTGELSLLFTFPTALRGRQRSLKGLELGHLFSFVKVAKDDRSCSVTNLDYRCVKGL